ncbi:MAG: hypothetical protein QXU18_03905 [Thermoplasmatales archaeon]
MKEEVNYRGFPDYQPKPLKSYQTFTRADMNKTKRELHFKVLYDLRMGIRKIVDGMR